MPPPKLQDVIGLTLPWDLRSDDTLALRRVQDEVLALFDDCAPGLRRYVRTFGLSAEATDDVVQDVFLALFRHLQLGRPRSNLKGWLFQVAHNLALKERHRMRRRQFAEGDWDGDAADRLVDPAAGAEERLARDDRSRHLRAVLRAVPERDRRCLYLRAEGLGYRDIARALGVSLGAVAKSVTRALARLTDADRG
jgi:RNA polymerase sigma-70 factor (ECF subfamily)